MLIKVRFQSGDIQSVTVDPGATVQGVARQLGLPGGVFRINGNTVTDHDTVREGDTLEIATNAAKLA